MFPRSRNGPQGLVHAILLAYHAAMKIIRSGDKEVAKFQTPSGVTGIIATSIPDAALAKFARSLKAKIKRSSERSSHSVDKTK